jgi:RimJ/RimL family protein N-acetyltransferase
MTHDSFVTTRGLEVRLEPLTSADVPRLLELFAHMGSESRYQRFNVPLDNPDPDMVLGEARRLATIEPGDGAWLAVADLPDEPGATVGGARFIRVAPDVAEVSLVVRDELQGQGIGTAMLAYVIERARQAGIRHVTASVQSGNRAIWRVLQKSGLAIRHRREGPYDTVEAELE